MSYNARNEDILGMKEDMLRYGAQHDLQEPEFEYGSDSEGPKRRGWKIVFWLFFIIVISGVVGYISLIAYNVAKISTNPVNLSSLTRDETARTNILILGVGDKGHAGEQLTDTIMILSIDHRSKRVAQISIPRDLRVAIPGHGYGKINSANAIGGVELAEQTVSNTFDIPIHYYIKTNFSGVRQLVDAVGGIDVNVKERLYDPEYPCDDNESKACGIDIKPGLQHMDGTTALQYARCRKGTCGNDFGRADRQQEVMNLLRDKVVQWQVLANPLTLAPLTMAIQQSMTTDMGSYQLLQLAQTWRAAQKNQPIRLVFHTGNGGYLKSAGGSSDLLPSDGTYAAIQQRVKAIFETPTQPTDLPE